MCTCTDRSLVFFYTFMVAFDSFPSNLTSSDNDVSDLQHIHGILQDRSKVSVGGHHHVSNVTLQLVECPKVTWKNLTQLIQQTWRSPTMEENLNKVLRKNLVTKGSYLKAPWTQERNLAKLCQIRIFLQPRFPWNKGSHFPSSATFWGPRSCEVCSNQSCLYVDRKYQLSSGESWDFMSAIYGLPTNECMWFPWQSRVYIYMCKYSIPIYI